MRQNKPGLFLGLVQCLYCLAFFALSNCYLFLRGRLWLLAPAILGLCLIGCFAGLRCLPDAPVGRKICCHGNTLLVVFYGSVAASVVFHALALLRVIPCETKPLIYSAIYCTVCHFILFWNGIACVYLTSHRLGVKLRVVGVLCGWIPVVNLAVLYRIIRTTFREVVLDTLRHRRNRERADQAVCATRYPLLLVHGVFFRDNPVLNYWGRIPKDLEANGAQVYYGNHQSALSVEKSAQELVERIGRIVAETGCEKVNIIAHSKGGLDCRYALEHWNLAPMVASLTTINTPPPGLHLRGLAAGKGF